VGGGVVALVGLLAGAAGVVWRTAVGGRGVRARPGVGVSTLDAGGSGLDVSRLRGLFGSGVGVRAGAAGATGATGAAGKLRGTARGSAICGALKGVRVGKGVGGMLVGDGGGVGVCATSMGAATAIGSAVGVGGAVASGAAASAAASISTRCKTIVLPNPSRYPPQASKNRIATSAYLTRCQSLRASYQENSRCTRGGYPENGADGTVLARRSPKIKA
jgi:hypothetical protein